MGSNKKLVWIILAVMAVVALSVIYSVALRRPAVAHVAVDGIMLPQAKEIKDFQLTDNQGKPFTKENLNGHWTLMFFGFTNCGMVCPVTMAALNDMYKTLEKDLPADKMPQVLMISVDPDRDSAERMNEYVTAFNSKFIGARGDINETIALENQLHIAAAKVQTDDQGKNHYTINHSAEILVFNPQGQLQAYLSYPHHAEQMVKDYKAIIAAVAAS